VKRHEVIDRNNEQEELMINQSGPRKQICLLNSDAQCDPIWVCRPDGLCLAHIQTLNQGESKSKNSDASVPAGLTSGFRAYEKCARGCIGPMS
jgi:hypothetical protein